MATRQQELDFQSEDSDKKALSLILKPSGYKGPAGFHKYWGKKPTEAWTFLVQLLTQENDVIIDPFLGSGLIAKEVVDLNRRFVGIDINPISIELARLFLEPPSAIQYAEAIGSIEKQVHSAINQSYLLEDGEVASHFLWEGNELKQVWKRFGKSRKREERSPSSHDLKQVKEFKSYESRHIRPLRIFENSRINASRGLALSDLFTGRALRNIDLLLDTILDQPKEVRRALLLTLTAASGQMSNMVFAVTKRGKTSGLESSKVEVGSWVIGYWRPETHFEVNVWNCFQNKANRLQKGLKEIYTSHHKRCTSSIDSVVNGGDTCSLVVDDAINVLTSVPDESVKLILTDPPHGDRIPYLELSELWNALLGLDADFERELVISNALERRMNVGVYNKKMSEFFAHSQRVLKVGGYVALMFNARSKGHWESLKSMEIAAPNLRFIGRYPMHYVFKNQSNLLG